MNPNMSNKTWSGTSMDDLYENNGPYSFVNGSVAPSKDHAVLYELPATLTTPPKPHRNAKILHWDDSYVKLPYSPQNVFPIENENGEKILKNRWEVIQTSLLQLIQSSRELEAAIKTYNTRLPPFSALHYFFEEVLEKEEGEAFFKTILPGIIRLALQLPEILPGNLPCLQKETCRSVSLSQLQIASLLANGFLCTFPWRKEVSNTFPGLNFARLFAAHSRPKRVNCIVEKIKAICHYFRRILTKAPVGILTFERKFLQRNQFPRWDKLDHNMGNTKIHICSNGTIENNGHGLLQVDFANKFVGGGVLGYGCVQEEIRFVLCPELMVSRLFTEELNSSEALVIIGAERYSNYSGYGDTFIWEGDHVDQTPHDCYGRRKTSIVAIDATKFNKSSEQFSTSYILRELNKAYVGFHSNLTGKLAPVATGNWGCGAFRGDANLKSLIQLMACSATNRNMVYYTFGDSDLEKTIYDLYIFLANNKVTVCELWRSLCRFVASNTNQNNFIPYIQQAYFDLHNQPSISYFFGSTQANSSSQPSTSSRSDRMSETWPKKSSSRKKEGRNIPTTSSSTRDFQKTKKSPIRNTQVNDREGDKFCEEKKEKFDDDDVIDLIKIIDGDVDERRQENTAEQSLLFSIDNFNRTESSETSESVCINMEFDDESCEKQKGGPKRKISDYFVTLNK